MPWHDSIPRPISTISSVAGGDITTRSRRQGSISKCLDFHTYVHVYMYVPLYMRVYAFPENTQ
jgi:hypothetical protein